MSTITSVTRCEFLSFEGVVLIVGMRRTNLHDTQEWSHNSQLFVADEFTCYEEIVAQLGVYYISLFRFYLQRGA